MNADDPVAAAAPSRWAMAQLRQSLAARGMAVRLLDRLAHAPAGGLCVVAAGAASPLAGAILKNAGATIPAVPEALGLLTGKTAGRSVLLAAGHDSQGLVYAILELADRVQFSSEPMAALGSPKPVAERPANATRSIARLFCSDVEDKPWFYDREFWQGYLSMLAAVLKACPAISGLTFRTHGESGVAEGSYEFWKAVFDAVVRSGRRIELDLHPKGIDQTTIDMALASAGRILRICPRGPIAPTGRRCTSTSRLWTRPCGILTPTRPLPGCSATSAPSTRNCSRGLTISRPNCWRRRAAVSTRPLRWRSGWKISPKPPPGTRWKPKLALRSRGNADAR